MKTTIVFLSLLFCFLVSSIKATSMPDCSQGCNPKYCPELPECKCGLYKDYCECCSFCQKCPGEECILVANEKCANGTVCRPRPGAVGLERINGPGWCS